MRTESFIWSQLIPNSRRGTTWNGLAHIADWFYTYAVGVAGVNIEKARGAGPYPDDAVNLWDALTSNDIQAISPRKEVIHMVHSPLYYPGNCSFDCYASRNCPAVITSGEMKLMLGYVGDPRIVPLNFTAGVPTQRPIVFGLSGGHCNVKPPTMNQFDVSKTVGLDTNKIDTFNDTFNSNDLPDPHCLRGILSLVDNLTCCSASCGACGGRNCNNSPGGAANCCRGHIDAESRSCDTVGPPCKENHSHFPPGPPGPDQYFDRCTSPGVGGHQPPSKNGLCVDGCLFNLTADPTESHNLIDDPVYQPIIYKLKLRLHLIGATAPPWAAVPEIQHMSSTDYNKALCDAAKRFGALAPIDV